MATGSIGLALDIEHQLHRRFHQVGISSQTCQRNLRPHRLPNGQQNSRTYSPRTAAGPVAHGRTGVDAFSGCRKRRHDDAVAMGNGKLSLERIHLHHQFCGLKPGGALDIGRIGDHGVLEIAIRERVAAELERRPTGSRQCRLVVVIGLQTQNILGEGVFIILRSREQVSDVCLLARIVTQIRGERYQLGLRLCLGVDFQQKFDQFEPRCAPVRHSPGRSPVRAPRG